MLYAFDLLELDGEDPRFMPIEERKRIPAKRMKASPSKSTTRATEVIFKHVCDPPSFPAVLPTLRTDLKGMRELVTKYGDHMQTHLVDAIRGHCAQEMRQPGVAIHPHLRSAPDADDCMPASMTLAMRSIHFPANEENAFARNSKIAATLSLEKGSALNSKQCHSRKNRCCSRTIMPYDVCES